MEIPYTMTVEDAGKIIGRSAQYVRLGLQQQRLPIGSAVQMSAEWTYNVSTKLLIDYIGEKRVKEFYNNEECYNGG